MIWRILVFMSWSTVFVYVDKHYGREAAWCASSLIMVILLPLSQIERRLAVIAEGLPKPQPCAKNSKEE